MTISTQCNECGANGALVLHRAVVENFNDNVSITADGFDLSLASFSTTDEEVRCIECGHIAPMEEAEEAVEA